MKILIVDDSRKVREMIKGILVDSVEEILECDNGFDALTLYEQHHPDCVLMDIEMQPVDGIKTTGWIKQSDPDARIIIVTQYDTEEFREKAHEAGVRKFISKEDLTGLPEVIKDLGGT